MRKIFKDVLNKLCNNPKRLFHVIDVALISSSIASNYHLNISDAFLVGLIHDYSKHETNEFHKKYIDLKIFEKYQNETHLYHALSAANYFKEKYNINNNIYVAVKNHVYGFEKMDKMTQILYIADSIYFKGNFKSSYIYKIALKDLNLATYEVSKNNIENIKRQNKIVADKQLLTYNYYKEVTNWKS